MPKAACSKKCRRVMPRRDGVVSVVSLFGDGFVEVEQHVGDHRPRGEVGGVGRAWLQCASDLAGRGRRCLRSAGARLRRARRGGSSSSGLASRDSTSLHAERGARARRRRRRPAASPIIRAASARAASNDAGSLRSVSAWSGVFVRTRRTVTELAAGRVERHEARIGRRAPPERVEAAAVAVLARRSSSTCRRCTACSRCPSAGAGRRSGRTSSR